MSLWNKAIRTFNRWNQTPLADGDSRLNLELTGTDLELDEEFNRIFCWRTEQTSWDQPRPRERSTT